MNQAWSDLINLAQDGSREVERAASEAICSVFSQFPDKEKAYVDIHQLLQNQDNLIRSRAAHILGSSFSYLPDKKKAYADIRLLTQDKNNLVRRKATHAITLAFIYIPNMEEVWEDLHRLANDPESWVRREAVIPISFFFSRIPNKETAWYDIHKLTLDPKSEVRNYAVYALGRVFFHVPDKLLAWEDIHRLSQDQDFDVRRGAANNLGFVFYHIPDKMQAWKDLIRLTLDTDSYVGFDAARSMVTALFHVPDKEQTYEDLHQLTENEHRNVRRWSAEVLGLAFSYVPDIERVLADLNKLAQDEDRGVKASANYSLGKISIFKATKAESTENFRNELEKALDFFDKSLKRESYFNHPAQFCSIFYRLFYLITYKNQKIPFYRSFFQTIISKQQKIETEIEKKLAEAKSVAIGSDIREKLLEIIENLSNALKEAQKARDFYESRANLNAYRRYCDRACELLETTQDKAPGASRLIRKGLPIIDERIKGILAEIEENTTALCKQTKGTQLDNFGREIYWQGHNLPQIHDPIKLDKKINGMQNTLTLLCGKLIEENIMEELEILNKINDERYVENKVEMMDSVMRRILIKVKSMKKIDLKINGNDNKINIDSVDNSINIKGDLTTDLETLSALIERDYKQDDRNEVLQTVNQMKQSCNDSSKKSWIKQKLGWVISRTSEVASISSFAISLLQNVK